MYKGKNKIQIDYATEDIFKFYCKTTGNPKDITQKVFTAIIKDFFDIVIDKMITDNFEMTLPKRLGNFRIIKKLYKPKLTPTGELDKRSLIIDFKATREMWKKLYPDKSWEEILKIENKPNIYNQNKHTDGYLCKWHWDRRTCLVKNATYYKFDVCRTKDRKLAKVLKSKALNIDFYTLR